MEINKDIHLNDTIGRNDPCPCGSGKKYKKCCMNKVVIKEELGPFMSRGYGYLIQEDSISACNEWLKAFDLLKQQVSPEIKSISDGDKQFPQLIEPLFNWCQDLGEELVNAAYEDKSYYEKLIQYVDEFCAQFPESDASILLNMKLNRAEAFFGLGNEEKGDAAFEKVIEEYPHSVWGYVRWGDMYGLFCNDQKDKEKAEQIYRRSLNVKLDEGEEGRQEILERINPNPPIF